MQREAEKGGLITDLRREIGLFWHLGLSLDDMYEYHRRCTAGGSFGEGSSILEAPQRKSSNALSASFLMRSTIPLNNFSLIVQEPKQL